MMGSATDLFTPASPRGICQGNGERGPTYFPNPSIHTWEQGLIYLDLTSQEIASSGVWITWVMCGTWHDHSCVLNRIRCLTLTKILLCSAWPYTHSSGIRTHIFHQIITRMELHQGWENNWSRRDEHPAWLQQTAIGSVTPPGVQVGVPHAPPLIFHHQCVSFFECLFSSLGYAFLQSIFTLNSW